MVEDSVDGWRLHDFVTETGELAVGLVADDHSVFIGSFYLIARQIFMT